MTKNRVLDRIPSEAKSLAFGYAYGMVRDPINNFARSALGNTPVGNIGDEALVIISLIAAKRLVKSPLVSQLARTGLAIEGHNFARSGGLGSLTASTSASRLTIV